MPNRPTKTMVCVTVQRTCEQLIHAGVEMAQGAELHVVHVAPTGARLLGQGNDAEALEYLFRIARGVGAEMSMLRADDVIETIAAFAEQNGVECIVLGAADKRRGGKDFSAMLRLRLPNVTIRVISR